MTAQPPTRSIIKATIRSLALLDAIPVTMHELYKKVSFSITYMKKVFFISHGDTLGIHALRRSQDTKKDSMLDTFRDLG
jgi:hypothetical protein